MTFLVNTISPGSAPMNAATCGPGALVGVRGLLAQLVRGPVGGGVVPLVEVALGVQDLARLLRGGARSR